MRWANGHTFQVMPLPQKRYFRQRAHANPLSDHDYEYPLRPCDMDWSTLFPCTDDKDPLVRFADVGCGYGGLLIDLSKLYPDTRAVGFELRVKVSDYVRERIAALREEHGGEYNNIALIRANAMKHLPNFFFKGQLTKMFFLFPDPHFKKEKRKWRIISPTLLSEYAYILQPGGILYTITDVQEVHEWMLQCLEDHPLFVKLSQDELDSDPTVPLLFSSTEEGKKVSRNDGSKHLAVFRRIELF